MRNPPIYPIVTQRDGISLMNALPARGIQVGVVRARSDVEKGGWNLLGVSATLPL